MEDFDEFEREVNVPWTVQGKEIDLIVTFEPDEELETGRDCPYLVKVEVELSDYKTLDISDLFSFEESEKIAFAALALWRAQVAYD